MKRLMTVVMMMSVAAAVLRAAGGETPSFSARMTVDLSSVTNAETLWTMGPARLTLRFAGQDKALADYDRRLANYCNFRMPDGTCPVLEATICDKAGRIGIPLGAITNRGACAVTLRYASPSWRIEAGGETDEEFPVPKHPVDWSGDLTPRVRSPRVSGVKLDMPAAPLPEEPDARPVTRPIQYWTPDGYNQWVGDVAPGWFDGTLHVFYLLDRRHHKSGAGGGRHQFAHLVTDDLVRWTERPLAVPITEEWQTVGTGTPFLKDGKVAIAFGWHTDRFCTPTKERPMGGTYAVSDDGIRFRWTKEMVSDAQNPSIYNLADGRYELVTSYGGSIGIFRSANLRDWTLFDDKLPFRGDCPSLFDWHGRRYLLQGFTNMAYSPDGAKGSFVNWSGRPDALYDGLSVPMVTKWKDDRRLYIGWLMHLYGWGGWLVFREVVSYPDGALGLKWVPEIVPPTRPVSFSCAKGEKLVRRFVRTNGNGPALVFAVDPSSRTASFADDVEKPEFKGLCHAANVRIGDIRGIDGAYGVRLIVHYDAKADATIFDAEIAGQRTLICRREGRFSAEGDGK